MSGHLISLGGLFLVALATSVIPGPSNFLTMRVAMRRGRGPALATALGTTLGCVIWCAAAVLGLAALLAAWPWLYKLLRIGGGLYLVWFAVALALAAQADDRRAAARRSPHGASCRASPSADQPQVVLFFASVFSAYVGRDPAWVHAAAVAMVTLTALAWLTGLGVACSAERAAQAYRRAQKPLDRGAAGLMGAFGLSLLWTSA